MADEFEDNDGAFLEDFDDTEGRLIYYPVIRPKPGESVSAILLSDYCTFTRSHYLNRDSYPCIGAKNGCKMCLFQKRRIMKKGYMAALTPKEHKFALVELTVGAIISIPTIRFKRESVRGRIIHLSRTGEEDNSPVVGRLETCFQRMLLDNLPEAFNVVEAVKRMWKQPLIVEKVSQEAAEPGPLPPFTDEEIPC